MADSLPTTIADLDPEPADLLDLALAAAFALPLDDSARRTRSQSAVTLAAPPATGTTSLSVLAASSGGQPKIDFSEQTIATRYQFFGELARGGMGVLFHGRDGNLGREVAFKVIRAEHQHNPVMVRRFLEEAQIGAQLQHPGVVPVYELGQFTDLRPCFTMKLVNGCTLAALLQQRKSPAQDLPRFLRIFEQICQTVAYAHSRGIIHRDLKPLNIMVGEFGEVLVMDWGLAKVLAAREDSDSLSEGVSRTEGGLASPALRTSEEATRVGTVLGTPAYMSPEQARGETDRLDARCDVFALGAILCEILTGKPPYLGTTFPQVHRKAEAGDLKEALTRIDGWNQDPILRTIVRKCLSTNLAGPAVAPVSAAPVSVARAQAASKCQFVRPAHAGEVADAMKDYHSQIEVRARTAATTEVDHQWQEAFLRTIRILLAAVLLSAGLTLGWVELAVSGAVPLSSGCAGLLLIAYMASVGLSISAQRQRGKPWFAEAALSALGTLALLGLGLGLYWPHYGLHEANAERILTDGSWTLAQVERLLGRRGTTLDTSEVQAELLRKHAPDLLAGAAPSKLAQQRIDFDSQAYRFYRWGSANCYFLLAVDSRSLVRWKACRVPRSDLLRDIRSGD